MSICINVFIYVLAKGWVSEALRPRDKSTPRLFLLNVWNVYKGLRRLRVSKRFRDRLRISYLCALDPQADCEPRS